MKEFRIATILLVLLLFVVFLFILASCKKSKTESPGPSPSSGYGEQYYPAYAKVIRIDKCNDGLVLLEFSNHGWASEFSLTHGFNYRNEYWCWDIPDTLKAPGQELELFFKPVYKKDWISCGFTTAPNQIRFSSIKPMLDWSEIEIVEISSGCGKAIVKIDPYFKDTYGNHVLAVNLPDSLKVIGRKMGCNLRYASIFERIGICDNTSVKQVVLTDLYF